MRRTLFLLTVFITTWFLVPNLVAQETTGTISGVVSDATGAVVPEVNVKITHKDTGGVLTVRTGGAGNYIARALKPGRYSLSFEKDGFSTGEISDLILLVGKRVQADVALQVGAVEEVVVVIESAPLIDTSSTMIASNVTAEEFDRLPKPRTFHGVALFSPSVNTGIIDGGYQINGASAAENNYYIDGVSTTSLLDGSARQTAVLEHLQEVQVKTAGLDAEYGGALGGVVSAVTKSGGSDLHGSIHYYYYGNGVSAGPPKRMQINPSNQFTPDPTFEYFQDQKNKQNFNEFGGSLGGALVKEKLFFFTSASPRWQRRTIDYQFSDGPGSMHRDAHSMSWFNRVDINPSDRVRMNFTSLYTPQYLTGSLLSYSAFAPNTSTASIADAQQRATLGFDQPEQSFSGNIGITLTNKSLLSIKGGRYSLNYKERGVSATKEWWWQGDSTGIEGIDPAAAREPGYKTPTSGITNHDLTTRTYLQADFSQLFNAGGQHNLKVGVGVTKNVNNVDIRRYGENGRIDLYWGATNYGSAEAGPYGFYRVNEGGTIGSAGAPLTHLYIQDAWKIHPRLMLNLGLRMEKETIPSFRRDIKDIAFKFGFRDKVAPRIGGSFDVLGNGKLKVSAFWGRFYDWTKLELSRGSFGGDTWLIHYRSLDTLDVFSLGLDNMPGRNLWFERFGADVRNLRSVDFDLIDPDLKPMSSDMMNFGVEYEIKPQTVFSARYVRNKLNRTIEDLGALDAGGNEVYRFGNPGEGANTVSPSTSTSTCLLDLPEGACGFTMPKAERIYTALELSLSRRFSRGWLGNVSYVYSELWGNYAGLQSTDEIRPPTLGFSAPRDQAFSGVVYRTGGNVNRYFDLDEAFWDANGNPGLLGRLPTDRPHVLKFYGAYNFKFGTQVGTFFRASSGTPVSTQVQTLWHMPFFVEGRGDMGRTPFFTQTDLSLAHEVTLGEGKKLRFEFNMMNLFNQKTSMYTFDRYNQEEAVDVVGLWLGPNDLSQGFDWQAMAAEASQDAGVGLDPRYGSAAMFNPGFSGRFGIKLIF